MPTSRTNAGRTSNGRRGPRWWLEICGLYLVMLVVLPPLWISGLIHASLTQVGEAASDRFGKLTSR